jgi:hypothetical protein
MPLVQGPFMSLDASGTLAKTLVASHWKGRNYIRSRVIPLNPKSAAQTGVRAMLSWLAKHWVNLSVGEKASYEEAATSKSISPFNQYCSANLLRWQQNKPPTEEWPAAEASTPLTVTTQTLTGYAGYATISITPSGSTAIGGLLIFRDTAEITDATWANCIAVVEPDGANAVLYTDSPLEADTYHYRTAVFNTDGILGTIHADGTAVVT